MNQPIYLREGDTIWITATARKITLQEIKPAIYLMESWGYKVKIGNTIGLENHQFAGTDKERAADFQEALNNRDVKAIWCAKGGYGTIRMLDLLDFTVFQQYPKWIIGYSDITVLHSYIQKLGKQSLHATMPIDLKNIEKNALASLKSALSGVNLTYEVPSVSMNREGSCNGILTGGNLSVIYSMLGAKGSIETAGKILFLEDLDEYLYHIDRMMMNLKRNGVFDHLEGLIIGGMTRMHDNTIPFGKSAEEIILDITAAYDFPVLFNFPAGHIKNNHTLILGKEVRLDVKTEGNSHLKFM